MFSIKALKFPQYGGVFLFFIIFAKVVYLGVESYYNGYLVDVITNPDTTKDILESLESFGHNVSSVGLTLLVIPFFYLLFKKLLHKKHDAFLFTSLLLTTLGLFFSFHTLLTSLMDEVVAQNKEKRYTSYYISIFKYGMLNGSFGYESFIPKAHLENPSVEDKVMISNIFLLNYIDEKLIQKLIDKGTDQFTDIFIMKEKYKEYQKSQRIFDRKMQQIIDGYNTYIEESREINAKFAKLDSADIVDGKYEKFVEDLQNMYETYEHNVINYEKSISLSDSQRDILYKQLFSYFKNQKDQLRVTAYKELMLEKFGHYVEPKRWCRKYCPDKRVIDRVVEEESYKEFVTQYNGIAPDLNQRRFFRDTRVKKKVIEKLAKEDLLLSLKFNYSKKEFADAYKQKINKEFREDKKALLQEIYDTTGKKMQFGLKYDEFISYFKEDIEKKYGKKYGSVIFEMLEQKDTTKFYSQYYKPYFQEKYLSKYLFSREDFKTDKYGYGDNAIKHLYIPPFAITVSLIAAILNTISVVVILLFLFIRLKKFGDVEKILIKVTLKSLLLGFIVWYPFAKLKDYNLLKEYKALEKLEQNDNMKIYIKALEWVIVYEQINYEKIYPYVKILRRIF